jgi:hypothetical protein
MSNALQVLPDADFALDQCLTPGPYPSAAGAGDLVAHVRAPDFLAMARGEAVSVDNDFLHEQMRLLEADLGARVHDLMLADLRALLCRILELCRIVQ